ncbi:MAG: hypothetical protein HY706_02390, partial [Candidatus Hydrogenedentes bacterium]|nr:hypothetical protein [Candidatus Hydrogenedentota bacterium]
TLHDNLITSDNRTWNVGKDIAPGETVSVTLSPDGAGWSPHNEVITGLSIVREAHLAAGREFDSRDALRRGAVIFSSSTAGTAPCALTVNGRPRPESGRRTVQAIAYLESAS